MGIKRIVLVHGSAHGAWCWETVSPLLERLGYEVNALDLPGSGDDLTAAKDVSLGLCIDRVVQEVESGTSPVLLVGHSMAGIIVSGVGEAVPQKIGKLVYVAAFLLRSGEAMVGLKRTSSEESAARAIRPSEIEGAFELDRSMVPDIFYNCCEPGGRSTGHRATKGPGDRTPYIFIHPHGDAMGDDAEDLHCLLTRPRFASGAATRLLRTHIRHQETRHGYRSLAVLF